jgi:hypothetical protein
MLCSKPLDDEKKVTATILDALRETGQRGIISRGWGALGSCKLPGLVFVALQLSPLLHIPDHDEVNVTIAI